MSSSELHTPSESSHVSPDYEAIESTLAEFHKMRDDIRTDAYGMNYLALQRYKIAQAEGRFANPVPPTYEEDLIQVETNFAEELVDNVLSFVIRAKSMRAPHEGSIKRL